MAQEIKLKAEFVTLGQLLKEAGVIETGGQTKWFLKETTVLVNGEPDDRRGRKLYPEDVVEVSDNGQFVIKQQERL
ncbi:S4 domain-containing protein YaaA [Latilactobacillus curvatus]|uniref:S4 domain-containing protein YaaA n=1 Tax=Latilactobacillus curvatus TaxID=28038 RepID=UPI000B601015|nr:S4 domain-containing protein YaaA [Latilactobacillus curvatus]ASN61049.1 RNA-binding protein [Latilactobacillus curvatus]MCT2880323.1 S4 domain-containing protein YaaA [Latilactobacillus curvatus]